MVASIWAPAGSAPAVVPFTLFEFTATSGQTHFSIAPLTGIEKSQVKVYAGSSDLGEVNRTNKYSVVGTDIVLAAQVAGTYVRVEVSNAIAPGITDELPDQSGHSGDVLYTDGTNPYWGDPTSNYVTPEQYGAVGNGIADDTVAVQLAVNTGRGVFFNPTSSYYISSSIFSAAVGQVLFGGGTIKSATASFNAIQVQHSEVVISDLTFINAVGGGLVQYKAAVLVNAVSKVKILDCTINSFGYWGFALFDSSDCTISGNNISGFTGSLQDSACIVVYRNSNNNVVRENKCLATCEHGIFLQDPYLGTTPTGNKFIKNRVAGAVQDGISIYVTTAYDTQTLVDGNTVSDIAGTALGGLSGHGIYIQSAGGTVIVNNQLTRCCLSTTSFETQVVAAIGVSVGDTALYPTGTISEVIVANNRIVAQRGPGISVQTCSQSVIVQSNVILSTGTAAVRGEAIYSVNADGLQVKNNVIRHSNANYAAISIQAASATLTGISVSGNRIRGTSTGIAFSPAVGSGYEDVSVMGNQITGVSSSGIYLQSVNRGNVCANTVKGTGIVYYQTACPKIAIAGNTFNSSSGTYSIVFSGAANGNAGTILDETNILIGVVENDTGTGARIIHVGAAAPTVSGLYDVGDRVIALAPTVGNPVGWSCTTAGNPGTWTAEAILGATALTETVSNADISGVVIETPATIASAIFPTGSHWGRKLGSFATGFGVVQVQALGAAGSVGSWSVNTPFTANWSAGWSDVAVGQWSAEDGAVYGHIYKKPGVAGKLLFTCTTTAALISTVRTCRFLYMYRVF